MTKVTERWANIISIILNPLFMPLLGFLLLFSFQAYFALLIPYSAKLMILSVVFINTALLPFLSIIVLKRMGLVTSINLERREERLYPLLLGTILMYLTYFLFRKLSLPGLYSVFLFGASMVTLLVLVISFRYKISMHMTAIGGVTGLLLAMQIKGTVPLLPWLALAIFLSGLVATARLVLKAHTPDQVYSGFFLGTLCMLVVYLMA